MSKVRLENIPIKKIITDPNQPRKNFEEEKIRELADSIKQQGLNQAILVVPRKGGTYRLVYGERRLRACKLLGKKDIRAEIRELTEEQILEIQLVENLQREDLSPIEEAEAFQKIIYNLEYTHKQLAKKICKSREYVTNKLRLLKLPENVIELLREGKITEGHARLLLQAPPDKQEGLLNEVVNSDLNVRELESLVKPNSNVTRETLEESIDEKTMLIPISFRVYKLLTQFSKRSKSKLEALVNRAIMNLIQMEGE